MKRNTKIMNEIIMGIVIMAAVTAGCRTTDLETQTKRDDGFAPLFDKVRRDTMKESVPGAEEIAVSELNVNIEPEIIIIEKPVFVPEKDWVEEQKLTPVELTKKITEQGIIRPENYSKAAFIYDYYEDQVYEVYAQILRTTDINLESGEMALDAPFISDSENWIVGAGISKEGNQTVQHLYLKPKKAGLEATLIINTDRRVYHIMLKSYNTVFMPIVKWKYKTPDKKISVIGGKRISGGDVYGGINMTDKDMSGDDSKNNVTLSEEIEYVDPRFLSFDYKVRYSVFKKPRWLPRLVYDDGQKTYLVFNPIVLQTELPVVLENNRDIINYRVSGDLVVIDKLVEKITVKYQKDKIIVEKKKK
jgi:type IV secretion system protein VirB9